jgi:hypothetical protein
MKSKILISIIVLFIFTKSTYSAKLVFNQLITNQQTMTVQGGYSQLNPLRILLGIVPNGKLWKITNSSMYVPNGSNGYQQYELNGMLMPQNLSYGGNWLKSGDSLFISITSGNGPGTPYNFSYYFSAIEFNVVP